MDKIALPHQYTDKPVCATRSPVTMETRHCKNGNAFTERTIDDYIDNILCLILQEFNVAFGAELHRSLKSPDVSRPLKFLFQECVLVDDEEYFNKQDVDEMEEAILYQESINSTTELNNVIDTAIPLKEKSHSSPGVTRTNSLRKLISRVFMRGRDRSTGALSEGIHGQENKKQNESTGNRWHNRRKKKSCTVNDPFRTIQVVQQIESGQQEGQILSNDCTSKNSKTPFISQKKKRYAEFSMGEETAQKSGKLANIRNTFRNLFSRSRNNIVNV